jgi:hypothetical protein
MGDLSNCNPIEALLSTGSEGDPSSVARSNESDAGVNTLDSDSPQGGALETLEALDPADAKRDGGAGWVADATQDNSGASNAANAGEPGSTGSSQTGADAGSAPTGGDASGAGSSDGSSGQSSSTAGGSASAAQGATQGALW